MTSETTTAVNLNLDFSKSVIVEAAKMEWSPSPLKGVVRRRLEREDAEQGHATSIVRYDPGSSFKSHTHGGGEEYFVLEGTFSDQSGDYGAGFYVRNPPGSSHAPHSENGCTIFVKLCQMQSEGEPQVNIDTKTTEWQQSPLKGQQNMPLFENDRETVQLIKLTAGVDLKFIREEIIREILILEGEVAYKGTDFGPQSWFRFAKNEGPTFTAAKNTTLWLKSYAR